MEEAERTYTQFPNDILEPVYASGLSGIETHIVLFVVRMTFGYRRNYVDVSLSELADVMKMQRPNVSRAIKKLCEMGWLEKISAQGRKSQKLGIGKMFNKYKGENDVDNCTELPLSPMTTVITHDNTWLSPVITTVITHDNSTPYLNKKNIKENFKESKNQENVYCKNQEKINHVNKITLGQNHNVTLTEDEYSQLVSDYGEDVTLKFINRMDLWIKAKGRAPNDCFSELLVWLERDGKAPDPDVEKYKCLVNQF